MIDTELDSFENLMTDKEIKYDFIPEPLNPKKDDLYGYGNHKLIITHVPFMWNDLNYNIPLEYILFGNKKFNKNQKCYLGIFLNHISLLKMKPIGVLVNKIVEKTYPNIRFNGMLLF